MPRAVLLLLVVAAVAALWLASAVREQESVAPDEATVVAQLTAVAGPTPTRPTP
jgi:hypothetical protein